MCGLHEQDVVSAVGTSDGVGARAGRRLSRVAPIAPPADILDALT